MLLDEDRLSKTIFDVVGKDYYAEDLIKAIKGGKA